MIQVNKKINVLNRNRIDILACILQAAHDGKKKTHIMYQCNLSFRQLNAYLAFLLDMKFLETVTIKENNKEDVNLFKTNKKGRDLLEAYNNLRVLLIA